MRRRCTSAWNSRPTPAWASPAATPIAWSSSRNTASCARACASTWSACSAPVRRCRRSTASRPWATALKATPPAISSTCSTTACSACSCRSGASTATTRTTTSGARDLFSARLFALIGLGGERLRAAEDLNWRRLLPYLGLLSLRAHSAALVESVLRYYFKHADLRIEQCVERRVEIIAEQRNRLGLANSQLGESLVLGDSVRDRGGKFRIHIRQLSWARFHEFLPIGNGYQPLCALVRFTLRDPLDYDIRLALRHEEIRELRIGQDNVCHLGWTSWLGHEQADGVVTIGSKTH